MMNKEQALMNTSPIPVTAPPTGEAFPPRHPAVNPVHVFLIQRRETCPQRTLKIRPMRENFPQILEGLN
jgi:hypothetical protein